MFRWELQREDGSTVDLLQKDPKGWEDVLLVFERSDKYHGLFYETPTELGFFCKGAGKETVDLDYAQDGSEARLFLLISVDCVGGFEGVYRGKLNFSTYRQEFENAVLYTFLRIDQAGMVPLIRKREDVEIDILALESLDGQALPDYDFAGYDLNLHNKILVTESRWEAESAGTTNEFIDLNIIGSPVSKPFTLFPGLELVFDDIDQSFERTANLVFTSSDANLQEAHIISDFELPQTVTFNFNLCGTFTDEYVAALSTRGINGAIGMIVRVSKGQTDYANAPFIYQDIANTVIAPYFPLAIGDSHTIAFQASVTNFTFTLDPGDKLWFEISGPYFNDDAIVSTFIWDFCPDSFFSFSIDSVFPDTTGKAIAIHEAWTKQIQGIFTTPLNGQIDVFRSDYFGRVVSNVSQISSTTLNYPENGCGSFTAITNGLNIRQKEKPIRASLNDFFTACQAIWNIGLGVETLSNGLEVVRIERIEHFYDPTIILTLPSVQGIEMNFDEKFVFSEINLGYSRWETEQINGIDEPNTEATWTMRDIKSIKNNKKFISDYITSMYALEVTRRFNFDNSATTDWRYDNDNFIIALNRSVSPLTIPNIPTSLNIAEKDENISAANLISPETSYNLRFNLAANLRRLFNIITSGLVKQQPTTLKATQDEGNPDSVYTDNTRSLLNTICIGDNKEVAYTNVQDEIYTDPNMVSPDPLFIPEIYTFSHPVSYAEYKQIVNNPNGVIKFASDGATFIEGFILKLEYQLKTKIANFTLIRRHDPGT